MGLLYKCGVFSLSSYPCLTAYFIAPPPPALEHLPPSGKLTAISSRGLSDWCRVLMSPCCTGLCMRAASSCALQEPLVAPWLPRDAAIVILVLLLLQELGSSGLDWESTCISFCPSAWSRLCFSSVARARKRLPALISIFMLDYVSMGPILWAPCTDGANVLSARGPLHWHCRHSSEGLKNFPSHLAGFRITPPP